MKYSILLLLLVLLPDLTVCQTRKIPLNQAWTFKSAEDSIWMEAEVPGSVQSDLLKLGKIPDPFFGTNEDSIQWVELENWQYQTSFELNTFSQQDHFELIFEGLDTYTRLSLNGIPIQPKTGDSLFSKNMFCRYLIDSCEKYLRPGTNRLLVEFYSPIQQHLKNLNQTPAYHLTAGNDAHIKKVSVYTRKAPFQFGWDWSPRIVTMGIWKPVYLLHYQKPAVKNLEWLPEIVSGNKAVSIEADLWNPNCDSLEMLVLEADSDNLLFQKKTTLHGTGKFRVPTPNAPLWWPHSMGEPKRYALKFELRQGGQLLWSQETKLGFRQAELVQELDSIGTSFYFLINHVPVFLKGANWVPPDPMLSRISPDKKRKLLLDAKACGINFLRIWGGGVYEDSHFYDLCDSLGIMVWQDMMFACSMYPYQQLVKNDLRLEITQQVQRLKKYASIIIWNGNNEVDVAWKNWGWQKSNGIHGRDSAQMAKDYDLLFKKLIPILLDSLDPLRPYTHTSPLSNWGKPEFFNHHTMHYWGVWHGDDDFSGYKKYVGRFMNEYGFQSFPSLPTLKRFAPPDQWHLESAIMKKHQKSYIGNGKIQDFLLQTYHPPKDFADFVYKSQLCQRDGMEIAISAHRKARHRCGGTAFWQWNDSWPGPSWSAIDYFGRWKALPYRLKTLYAGTLIIAEWTGDTLIISLDTDNLENSQGQLHLSIMRFNGKVRHKETAHVTLKANTCDSYLKKYFSKKLDWTRNLVLVELQIPGKDTVQTLVYHQPTKELKLKKARIKVKWDHAENTLYVESKTLIKDLCFETEDGRHFSENYFDLLPRNKKKIRTTGPILNGQELRIYSLNPGNQSYSISETAARGTE